MFEPVSRGADAPVIPKFCPDRYKKMKCSKCQFENREEAKFCKECGVKLEFACSECGTVYEPGSKFCDECGFNFDRDMVTEKHEPKSEGERKHVTVLFSDLSGYTAMSEKLDPEEVKEIMKRIFEQIKQVIQKYEGFIEKFAGDAVMAIFGVPQAHEDDPIRAIKAAREIHSLVEELSPAVEKKIGQPLSMHSGINTGLVVTGEIDPDKGTHGVAGDALNLASRLSDQAMADEILVGQNTYYRAEGYFTFDDLEPTVVKGKTEPVQIYKVLSQKEKPTTTHRLSGIRAELVGRKVELAELSEAVKNLHEGQGGIFSICGDAGTGKSRLVEEFKASIDREEIQWIEGHAYAYSQNIPYFPIIDLLNRVFQIEESDPAAGVKEKLESGLEQLVGNKQDVIPYVGGLYSLNYPEVEEVSPEFWKSRLQEAIQAILIALATRSPTVFFLEDLHWADPSFVELLRRACLEIRQPAIVLCAYRPTFSLFSSHQITSIGKLYHEIHLQALSPSDAQDMLVSLLKTGSIPPDLKTLVQSKAEGNPFYLEELINSLLESGMLSRDNGNWRITKPIAEADISSSIHGLISGRLDHLENETKRILQEASVIGRTFLYEILKKISELKDHIDGELSVLERLDLLRTRSLQPDLEYMFKHPLTQEVVYSGLLKKDRQQIHEQIALVMESLFQDRLSEFYETLAFHFARGRSVAKAVDYLVKSGEKSLARYAVEESHQYFKKAFDILSPKENKSEEEKIILIDILNSWGYTYYYLGDIKEFLDRFRSHQSLAESMGDKARLGMFYVWLGVALYMAGKSKDSYEYLCKAKELGESSANQKVIGYACTWLAWSCGESGLFAEGIRSGERAQKIAESFPSDQYLFYKSLAGLCWIYWMKGDIKKVFGGAKRLLEYGEKKSNSRSMVFGHWVNSWVHDLAGDMQSSQKSSEKACEVALDPFYSLFPKVSLGYVYLIAGQFKEAEKVLKSLLNFSEPRAIGELVEWAYLYLAPALIAQGHMRQGLNMLEEVQQITIRNQSKVRYAFSEYILGKTYSQIATGPKPALSVLVKNIGFLVKNVPVAAKKTEEHFNKAIELLREIGAKSFLGGAYLDLGLFYKARKKNQQARECISEAIKIFEEREAEEILKQAKEALDSLK
jgi:class 3 adenylate cyclase/tetratricopeptide (TPR) repeat protein